MRRDDHDKVVLSQGENRVEQIVAGAAIPQINFQAIGEKAEKVLGFREQVLRVAVTGVIARDHRLGDEPVFGLLRNMASRRGAAACW